MNDSKNKNIEEELKTQNIQAEPPEKEAFWEEFRARAKNITQDEPGTPESIPFTGAKLLKIAACFLVIIIGISVFTVYNYPESEKKIVATQLQPGSTIEDYEIFTPNKGVMILQDEQTSGTILWVMDTDENNQKDDQHET